MIVTRLPWRVTADVKRKVLAEVFEQGGHGSYMANEWSRMRSRELIERVVELTLDEAAERI